MALSKARLFSQLADALEGKVKVTARIGLTIIGSEHPAEMLAEAAKRAQDNADALQVIAIGPQKAIESAGLQGVAVDSPEDSHRVMDKMLREGELDAAVTMHYNFPLGIATVGRVVTPGFGRPMFLATTTGTAAVDRVESMVKNAIFGIVAAKASGLKNPKLGILNVDGSRQVERILKTIAERGYEINFANSLRADGGCVMRGNDLLAGTCDVMVTDTLTGNLLIKVFSAYTTGGNYEASGWGYGPGIGQDMDKIVLILSRASGMPVVEGAIHYAAEMVRGNLINVARDEFQLLRGLGFDEVISNISKVKKSPKEVSDKGEDKISPPPKKIVTAEISGIDVLQMEDAAMTLWKNDIYAETGMGCTGPVILVAEEDLSKASEILKAEGYI
ncbi:MAG: glycine/sarcosine/betaine reductase complex component C subunit alpha [Tepidanaerobacteraceae bacterium]|jgi:hypothetical protein